MLQNSKCFIFNTLVELDSSRKQGIVAFSRLKILSLERLKIKYSSTKLYAIVVFFGTAVSFIDKICSSATEAKPIFRLN